MGNSEQLPLILAIDDNPDTLILLDELLSGEYIVKVAPNGERGLKIAQSQTVDLILLDVMMSSMDGFEVCKQLKSNEATQNIPVIFLTASTQTLDEQLGLELGAVDYISKPISAPILLARVKTHLTLKAASDFLKDRNLYLETEVMNRTKEVRKSHEVMLVSLATLAEVRDNETGKHIIRTQNYVRALAQKMSTHPRFVGELTEEVIDRFYQAAPLHDLGKVGIPDRILLKPGKLTEEEFEIMKTHTTLGYEAIESAQERAGIHLPLLDVAKEIARSHQEKYDGSGYPQALKGDDIPLSARLMAIADVYDALISRRVYKEPMSHEEAIAIMIEGRGSHFDPDLFDGFIEIQEVFRDIACKYVDTDEDLQNALS